ncbi:MAG: hypothetical protein C0412_06460 [Flavobacterium sp.]|nr:hypothetical protein [Flavobacterium sp.]
MADIFRYRITRASEKLSSSQIKTFGVQSHPEGYNSNLVDNLKRFCREGKKNEYYDLLQSFLKGKDFISDLNQLHSHLFQAFEWVNERKKWNAFEFESRFTLPKSKESKAFQDRIIMDWIKIGDSLTALSALGVAGQPQLLDYQKLIKVTYLLQYLHPKCDIVRHLTDAQIIKILTQYSVILPMGVVGFRCCGAFKDAESNGVNLTKSLPLTRLNDLSKVDNPKLTTADANRPSRDCECTANTECMNPSNYCVCVKPYISDLLKVKEDLKYYKEGEIAYIENILYGEKRVREHRDLSKTEQYTETETTISKTEEKDHQVSERFNLQSNSESIIKNDLSLDAGITLSGKYGPDINFSSSLNTAVSFSKQTSEKTSTEFARDVVDRSVSKIQETVRQLVSKRIIQEIEEKNIHEFDNGSSNTFGDHVSGLYYWVNMFSKAQIMNYGKRMMFEFVIPEPAALYKNLLDRQLNNSNIYLPAPVAPKEPQDLNGATLSPLDIDSGNIDEYIENYKLNGVTPPPQIYTYVTVKIVKHHTEQALYTYDDLSVNIPANYCAIEFNAGGIIVWSGDGVSVGITIGNKTSGCNPSATFTTETLDRLEGNVPIAFYAWDATLVSITVKVKCEILKSAFSTWQISVYDKIIAGYSTQYLEYLAKKKGYEDELAKQNQQKAKYGRNPFLNREIERKELKRHAIALLRCNYADESFGAMREKVKPCGYPLMDFKKADSEGKIIIFFEQAFEWNQMNYIFYPDIWARVCKWPELIDISTNDALFDKFCTAGSAKVQIAVRPEYEAFVNWFLATGEIWGQDGQPPVPGDPQYVSIMQEIKEQKQCLYTDRDGFLSVLNGSNTVILNNSGYYWDYLLSQPDQLMIDNDINREIVIDCLIYRIIKIVQRNNNPEEWEITIERPYEGTDNSNVKYQVGALFVGASWEVKTPTNLVYLRNKKDLLPSYPLTD